jgi:transposase
MKEAVIMKNRQIDFKEQKFFIGLDIHKNNWAVTIRSNGLELKTFSMNPSAKELYCHMIRD